MLYLNKKQSGLNRTLGIVLVIAAVIGCSSLILEYGFYISPEFKAVLHQVDIVVVGVFIFYVLIRIFTEKQKREYFRGHWIELALLILFVLHIAITRLLLVYYPGLIGFLGEITEKQYQQVIIVMVQAYLVSQLALGFTRIYVRVASYIVRPSLILLCSYLFLIVIGTVLLLLPKASAPSEKPINVLDAVFTSTSSTCVTGLVVRDTGTAFSDLGHFVILGLIQVGGLGLVTLVTFISLLQQRALGLRQVVVLRDIMNYNVIGDLGKFLAYAFTITIVAEVSGAVILFFLSTDSGMMFTERVKWSFFHSISAFCNAGFSLHSTSFINYATDLSVMFLMMFLIVSGGIGFPVIMNLLQFKITTLPLFRRLKWKFLHRETEGITRVTIHTKLVLYVSAFLIFIGAFFFLILEYNNTLYGKPFSEKITTSLFQSITARTAGFNTVNIENVDSPGLVLMLGLMIVGASPLSTGGGIKTVTFIISVMTVLSMIKSRSQVEVMKRSIPRVLVRTGLAVFALYSFVAFVSSLTLSITEPHIPYLNILFETVSALSTVGLSTGITAGLSATGKIIICFLMLIGRLGPLVVLLSVASHTSSVNYRYPEENVIVS